MSNKELSQLLHPLMKQAGMFEGAPEWDDLPPESDWLEGIVDIPVETLEAVCDALGNCTLVRKNKTWFVYSGLGPARRTVKK